MKTVSEIITQLQNLEKEGFGNLPFLVNVYGFKQEVESIKVQGSGIISSAEEVILRFASPTSNS
jgi:hypothetical protein